MMKLSSNAIYFSSFSLSNCKPSSDDILLLLTSRHSNWLRWFKPTKKKKKKLPQHTSITGPLWLSDDDDDDELSFTN